MESTGQGSLSTRELGRLQKGAAEPGSEQHTTSTHVSPSDHVLYQTKSERTTVRAHVSPTHVLYQKRAHYEHMSATTCATNLSQKGNKTALVQLYTLSHVEV